jgi:uncharacterized protein YqeY
MTMEAEIQKKIVEAMKQRDKSRVQVLRMAKAALKDRRIELRRDLEDSEAMKVLQGLIKRRKESIEAYRKAGREERAETEQAEISVLEEFLPEALGRDEIEAVIDEVVAEVGDGTLRSMGPVMKAVMQRFAGQRVDGREVNRLVRERLQ